MQGEWALSKHYFREDGPLCAISGRMGLCALLQGGWTLMHYFREDGPINT